MRSESGAGQQPDYPGMDFCGINDLTCQYHPKGFHPVLLREWPVPDELVVPIEQLPENLKENAGQEWRLRQRNKQKAQ